MNECLTTPQLKIYFISILPYLNKEPRGQQSQSTVLPIESVVVRVKRKMIQVKESEKRRLNN